MPTSAVDVEEVQVGSPFSVAWQLACGHMTWVNQMFPYRILNLKRPGHNTVMVCGNCEGVESTRAQASAGGINRHLLWHDLDCAFAILRAYPEAELSGSL